MKRRWVWLGGWGIAPREIERVAADRWPDVVHEVVYPGHAWRDALEAALTDGIERLMGYSLGAFLLLRDPLDVRGSTTLLAPFCDFRAENKNGGKVSSTQLKFLIRRLQQDPMEAVSSFYKAAVISANAPSSLPYPLDDLTWGIEQLLETDALTSAPFPADMYLGNSDALLDAPSLRTILPGLNTLPNVGHDFAAIIAALPFH